MATKTQMKTLRAHQLAALVLDARLYARRSPEEACSLLGWDAYHLQALETAQLAPSLPELEAMAAIYAVPVDHFFGSKSLSDEMPKLRVETMQARSKQSLSREDLALETDLSPDLLAQYELGISPIPITDLEEITLALQIDLSRWIDSYAIPTRAMSFKPIDDDSREGQTDFGSLEIPKDLAEFITNPVNKQYLMIATKLSALPADQLRRIAESLLEITY
jgi:transcriptional regulator with XRE-family HTH domain